MDKFYEQFIFTKKSTAFVIYNVMFYFTAFLTFVIISGAITFLNLKIFILAVLMGAACYGFFRSKEKGYREYEYTFTNGNLEIDVIYNKKKRKKLFDEDIKNFDDFGEVEQVKHGREIRGIICFPWDCNERQYVIVAGGSTKQAFYITPDENMLKLIQAYFARRPRR